MFADLAGFVRISLARLLDYSRERRPARLELARHIKEEFFKKSALIGSDVLIVTGIPRRTSFADQPCSFIHERMLEGAGVGIEHGCFKS